jgi:hypothetical protein
MSTEAVRGLAVVAADIAGYSALMSVDEARTVRELRPPIFVFDAPPSREDLTRSPAEDREPCCHRSVMLFGPVADLRCCAAEARFAVAQGWPPDLGIGI